MMENNKNRGLFPRLGEMDPSGLADNLYAAAAGLEELLTMVGAVPGEDYSRMDLLRLVQPFVLAEMTREGSPGMRWFFPEDRDA